MAEPEPAGVAETHSAVVFLFGDRAYKVKKPVRMDFLDFTTREAREAVCHREVALNRRLAPDVYLGVADVTGPDGTVCDHLVVMRRLPARRRLASLVVEGTDVSGDLRRLAHVLATFHAAAERSPTIDDAARLEAQRERWLANTASLEAHAGTVVDARVVARCQRLADRYLDGRAPLFDRRIAGGHVVDGHGDLLAQDVFCLDDGPQVLDCLEFDDRLRHGDVLADVAFLAMDLERLGRPDAAASFLATYRELAAEAWPLSLAHHYIGYRAHVRAKVSCLRVDQGDASAATEACSLLDLALAHLERGRVELVLVGGLPGTGKSTLATMLGDRLGVPVIRSDEVRKELAGLPTDTPASAAYGEGLYRPEQTAATYLAMLDRARTALGLGESVVLDASWSDRRWRDAAAAVAADTAGDFLALRCELPPDRAAERIGRRARDGGDPSDATAEVAAAMAAVADPWPEARVVRTDEAPGAVLHEALAQLGRRSGTAAS